MIQILPQRVKSSKVGRVKHRLSTSFSIFQVNRMNRGPIEVDPVQ